MRSLQWFFVLLLVAHAGCYRQAPPRIGYVPPPEAKELADAAMSALRAGELNAALEKVSRAIEIDPKYPAALLYAGFIQIRRGELASASTYFSRGLAADPDICDAALFLGLLQENAGNQREARDYYGRALRCFSAAAEAPGAPPEKRIFEVIARYLAHGQMEAVTLVNAFLEKYPGHTLALRIKAHIIADDRDYFLRWAMPGADIQREMTDTNLSGKSAQEK
jgi:tetratricopeptide (TPR) repeat protein